MSRRERVTKVIDGDTFETASGERVRLAGVNAPEKGQPGYAEAKEALRKMIEGKEVIVDTVSRDKYGRAVANVYIGRESVNEKMKQRLKQ